MENYIYLVGTSPWGERCAQVGDSTYADNAGLEAASYVAQLRRCIGDNPTGTHFKTVWCDHDLGRYLDIRFYYDDEDQQHVMYMDKIETGLEKWDDAAWAELKQKGYALPPEAKVIELTRSIHYLKRSKGA